MKKQILLVLVIFLSCNKGNDNLPEEYNNSLVETVEAIEYEGEDNDVIETAIEKRVEEVEYVQPIQTTTYSFVVIYWESEYGNYGAKRGTLSSKVFETPAYISEDEKYKILDEIVSNAKIELISKKIIGRELKTYNSYAEASKERETYYIK